MQIALEAREINYKKNKKTKTRSHNADETPEKNLLNIQFVCISLSRSTTSFCTSSADTQLSKLKMEKLLVFTVAPLMKSPLHYLRCRLVELPTVHSCDSLIVTRPAAARCIGACVSVYVHVKVSWVYKVFF